ncbi:MAG: DUF3325 domain-containing protein [Myxococcota bacterium]
MPLETVQFVAVLALSYLGCATFALSQFRPWRAVGLGKRRPHSTGILRATGVALLSAGLAFALARDGVEFGLLLWPLSLAVAAAGVAFTLAWRPHWLRALGRPFAESRGQVE